MSVIRPISDLQSSTSRSVRSTPCGVVEYRNEAIAQLGKTWAARSSMPGVALALAWRIQDACTMAAYNGLPRVGPFTQGFQ